jgi:hypothetical protein
MRKQPAYSAPEGFWLHSDPAIVASASLRSKKLLKACGSIAEEVRLSLR